MEDEIRQYTTEVVNVNESYDYSQYKLVRRITLFEGHVYPTGKFDSKGRYKFWYDGISSRISNEVKNIDFDTKDVKIFSDQQGTSSDLAVLLTNLKLKEWLRDNEMDEEFNEAVEEGSGWGNCVWKYIKGKPFERCDLKNFYVINQTAQELCESPVIERHQFTSSDLRAKTKVWDNVDEVLEGLKSETYKEQIQSSGKPTTVPYYDIYERNGEVCIKDYKETKGLEVLEGDENKYSFGKVIGAGSKGGAAGVNIEYILFCELMKGQTNDDIYEEFHRGVYKGKWFREGLYELLFDLQVRLNQIGNQISQALELGSKIVLQSKDKLIVQNIFSDMDSGDIIRTEGLQQVPLVSAAVQQLVEEWNLLQQQMNDIANSSPIVTGEGLPQRMPFQVAALLNQNANKLFDYIRQKLAIPFTHLFENGILDQMVSELSVKEILRLTGDSGMLDRVIEMIVSDWYVNNMLAIGPHGDDIKDFLIQQQIDALKKRPQLLMLGLKQVFKDFKPSVSCVITGENSTLPADMQTLSTFIALENDNVRRTALIDYALAKKGFDVSSFPRTPPQQMAPPGSQPQPDQGGGAPGMSPNKKPAPISSTTQLPARPSAPIRGKVG